jgi:large repetitive protein
MKKYVSKLSFLLTILLVVQIVFPFFKTFGAEIIGTPQNLTVSFLNTNDIYFRWEAVNSADYYKVYKINDNNKILLSQQSSTLWKKLKAEEGNYNLAVSAVKGVTESEISVPLGFEIKFPKVASPGNIIFSQPDLGIIQITWDSVYEATYYKVYQIINNQKQLVSTQSNTTKKFQGLPEGEYVYEVSAVSDRFGESTNNNQIKVSVVYPKLDAPQGLTYSLNDDFDLQLKWQPVNNATGYKIYQIVNSEKKLVSSTTYTAKNFEDLVEGEYIYEISAISNLLGESQGNNQIKFSVVYPKLTAPQRFSATIENGNGVLLKWDPVQYSTSYRIFEIINGERVLKATTPWTSQRLSGLTEGEHTFEVSAFNDRFGESSERASTKLVVQYPEMLAPNSQIKVLNNSNILVYWPQVNYASSYNVYQIKDDELVFVDNVVSTSYYLPNAHKGRHEFVVTSLNEYFGESSLSNKVTADIKPKLEAPITEAPEVNRDKVKLEWSSVPEADSYNIYKVEDGKLTLVENTKDTNLTIQELSQGNYEFRIVPVTSEGIEGEQYSTVVVEVEQLDTTPPQTVANETTKWVKGEYQVELTATDSQSGVAQTLYSINGSEFAEGTTFTVTEEGVNTISFYSVDNAGNVEEVKTTEVKIDKTAPVTNSDITSDWNNGKVTVKLTATDDLSGVAKTFYSINGSAYTEGNTFTVSKEGITQVSYYSVDNAGNKEVAKIEELMIDNTAPVTKSDINDQWNSDAVKVNLTAIDYLSGVAKTYYSINGSEYFEGTSFTATGEGVIQVSFYSVDNAGNQEAVKTEYVKIDNTAPETVSNVTDKWNTADVTVNLTTTDNQSGVAATYYSVNGSDYVQGTEFTVSDEGINKVSFYSVDNVGNKEGVKTVDVKIDKTAPTTVSNSNDKWNKAEVTLNLSATDHLSGVAKTYYSINGSGIVEGTQFKVNQEGINKVSFYSVDNAGNKEEVQTVEVKIDRTAPVVSWDVANQYALGTSLPLTYRATDQHSGIAKETISVNGQIYENTDSVKLDKPGTYKVVVTITDHAGWTTTLEKSIEVYIPATLIVNPGVIKANAGDFTVKVSLPKGFDTNQIDLSTATLNGVSAKNGTNGLVQQAKNGQFKFNRDDFEWKKGMVTVEFRVLVNGVLVIGSTTVEVK